MNANTEAMVTFTPKIEIKTEEEEEITQSESLDHKTGNFDFNPKNEPSEDDIEEENSPHVQCKLHKNNLRIDKHTNSEHINWFKCEQYPYEGKVADSKNQKIKWFECDQCPFKTKNKKNLRNHRIVKHTADEEIDWFECEHCSYKAKRVHNLKNHLKTKHPVEVETYNCGECTYTTAVKRNLRLHIKSKHQTSAEIKWFNCEECSFKTKRKYYLKLHVMSKHPSS